MKNLTQRHGDTESWPKVRLGEVCEILAGDSAPQDKRLYENGKYPFVRTSDVGDIHFGVITDSRDHLNDAGVKKLRVFPKGSILFPKSGASTFLNHRVMLGMDARVVSHLAVIIPREKLDSKFLLHLLFTVDAKELMQDSSYPSLRAADIAKVEFSLPPLSVQQEIVARLEKELAAVDRMVKGFEAMKAEADQLFKAELKESFEDIKRRGAETRRLGEICENLDCRRIPITKSDRKAGMYPYFGASGIVDYVDGYLYDGDYLLVSEDGANLIARSTPIAFSVSGKIWVNNHAHILSFQNISTQYYVEYYFEAISIAEFVTGAAQPKFTQKALNELIIPLPSLTTQREVVAKLDAVREKCAKLKSAAEEGLKTAALMRKAILKEAFSSYAEATEDKE